MRIRQDHKIKKVYKPKHAEAKSKAYKRNKNKNKLNPLDLDYVGNKDFSID